MTVEDDRGIRIARVEVTVYRAPVETPVVNAFGTMTDRPAVIVKVIDRDGAQGLGEAWCNFPTCGAEHRARLIETFLGPLLLEQAFDSPDHAYRHLSGRAHRLALQAAEPGPLAQAIAGLDIALSDLAARRAGRPLWAWLSPEAPARVSGTGASMPAYASGINPGGAVEQAVGAWDAGFRAFKLKIGFGSERDLANLAALREMLGGEVPIAVDANQAWDLDEAVRMSRALAEHGPHWLEEPLAVDRPDEEWLRLAQASPVPLAGGENLRGRAAFDRAVRLGALRVLQPDVAKWGGLSGCIGVARAALAAGRRYCPHYLGGGIGLLASAHLLAAVGGDGMLEVDSNPNPLREGLAAPFPELRDGRFVLGDAPGLGVEPDPEVERFAVLRLAV
ncbi:MAG TPA: mandelate racemase/muconate lactonizing enzyme family protein [Geminicoccaceae bacterium]